MTKEELQRIIGRNLHRIRIQQDMTREKLAEKAGISSTFYANLECGNKMMSMVTLRKLADVLCVSTDALLYEDRPNERIRSIQLLLQDQPDQIAAFAEKMIRFCLNELPPNNGGTEKEGAAVPDEYSV